MFRNIPGGLALAVVLLGTIMAATTGIVGASVVMLTLIALPIMLERGYSEGVVRRHNCRLGYARHPHSAVDHARDPGRPDADLGRHCCSRRRSLPGLMHVGPLRRLRHRLLRTSIRKAAPPLGADEGPQNQCRTDEDGAVTSFAPPAFLIVLVLGSIFGGWATPTEAAGVGCVGALVLAARAGKLNFKSMNDMIMSSRP